MATNVLIHKLEHVTLYDLVKVATKKCSIFILPLQIKISGAFLILFDNKAVLTILHYCQHQLSVSPTLIKYLEIE
jgi:hypothetical protein